MAVVGIVPAELLRLTMLLSTSVPLALPLSLATLLAFPEEMYQPGCALLELYHVSCTVPCLLLGFYSSHFLLRLSLLVSLVPGLT